MYFDFCILTSSSKIFNIFAFIKTMTTMKKILLPIAVIAILFTACEPKTEDPSLIGPTDITLQSDVMTPEILWSFGRVSDVQVSPDNTTLLFGVSYYSKEQDKGNRELYTIPIAGGEMQRLTYTPQNEFNAIWRPDGKKIGYISSESGSLQIWEMNPDGSAKKKISDFEDGITGFKYSPDISKIVFTSEQKLHEKALDELYKDLPLAKGKVLNRMLYRHWDRWVETFCHLFLADFDGNTISNEKDIMKNEPWDVPLKPFWGMEQVSWSPDNRLIAYACKKKDGMAFTLSTNSDIFIHDVKSSVTRNFSRGMLGYDLSPAFSPDGKKLAWENMEREGYESDKNRIVVYDFDKNSRTNFSQYFDNDAHGITWSANNESIYFISDWYGSKELFRLDMNGTFTQLTEGIHNYTSITEAGDKLVTTKQSMSKPTEIFIRPKGQSQEDKELSFVNKNLLNQLTMGQVEKRWITTTDNKKMLTWVIYPPHFNPHKTYAALLYCQGGPQGMVSQFWSYRWNFQMMAANDYIIVAPNRRGVSGFGQEWKEQISGDYGGQNMEDYLTAIDALSEEPWIDDELLGAVGASYGGFSVFWLAGKHDGRFSAFIAHDGMFNLESQYLETDEMWFVNWDLGGAFWEPDNEIAQRSYANSPHKFVQNWVTPILIIHGEQDYRIAVTQGMSAFNAAKLLNVQSQFLYFPNENHWVLSPQNGILWQRTFFAWLNQWLKPPPGARR